MLARRQIPNALTLLRLVLAAGFFAALESYQYPNTGALWGNIAIGLFTAAAITDALDGYLARRWEVTSAFGRIMDPFCDKVLVLGALVYLAGPRFGVEAWVDEGRIFSTATGVVPAFAVIVLARELLVTAVRGVAESMGIEFGAKTAGKIKMILQSVGIPVILLVTVNFAPDERAWAFTLNLGVSIAMVVATIWSGWPYIMAMGPMMRAETPEAGD